LRQRLEKAINDKLNLKQSFSLQSNFLNLYSIREIAKA
jgi:hypothetical protein